MKNPGILRIIRITLALLTFTAITLLFVDFTGTVATWAGWLPRWQFVPALLSLNIVALAVILIATFLFGRIYCSVLCPLGIMQDILSRLRIIFSPRLKRKIGLFKFRPAANVTRRIILLCFCALLILGLVNILSAAIASLIEPYAAYGRIATGLFAPVVNWLTNIAASWEATHDSYFFYTVYDVTSSLVAVVGAVTLAAVGLCAVLGGRVYCNTICPVGTTLGFISAHSLFRPVINLDVCNGCRSCERHCKSSCIDSRNHRIDLSRCVACMDCLNYCSTGAISFAIKPGKGGGKVKAPAQNTEEKPASTSPAKVSGVDRRGFLTVMGALGGALALRAADDLGDGGLTPVLERKPAKRVTRVLPPGAVSQAHLAQHCVGCQLCVQNCPQGIIKTSVAVDSLLQPELDFTDNSCPPTCTVCSNICPAGAFHPLSPALKSSTKIGTAVVDPDTCIAATQSENCGNCERHCPVGAIQMAWVTEDPEDMRSIPVVDEEMCIGCGACEAHCPVGHVASTKSDRTAIHVEGLRVQREV